MPSPSSTRPPPADPALDRIHWRLATLALGYLGLCYASLWRQEDIQLVVRFFLGLDFKEFYDATHVYLSGGNPYVVARFVTPPASMLPNLVMAPRDFYAARDLWCATSVLMLAGGTFIVTRAAGLGARHAWLTAGFLFAAFPAQMLLERGNIDAIVFALLAVALVARPAWLSGAAWALACLIKIYPVLLGPFLWRTRGRAWIIAAVVVATVVTAAFWRETLAYGPHLVMRATEQLFEPNLSPVGYFGRGFHVYALAYVALNLVLDARLVAGGADDGLRRFLGGAWIVPMLFFPRDVLAYVGISLLLTFTTLDAISHRLGRTAVAGLAVLEGLIMLPTTGIVSVTHEAEWYSVPRIALFIYSLSLLALKLHWVRGARQRDPRPDTR